MAEPLRFHSFSTRDEAALALAGELQCLLSAALKHQKEATLIVSGGSTPVGLFQELRERDLPWDRIWIVPSDERVVPANHPDRNEAMIRQTLLRSRAAAAGLVSLLSSGPLPRPLFGPFEAAVLGMGEDGHAASLFPGSPDLQAALASEHMTYRLQVPQLDAKRVSLTPAAILKSKQLFLLFFGDGKRQVFERALAGGDVAEYPVRFVLQQDRVPVQVYWAP
jgi:6-phosphogluconolactonase